LGSGKTTFVKGLALSLDVKDTVTSPTFNIVKKYPMADNKSMLVHIDAYRLTSEEDAISIGLIEEFKDRNNIFVIEWPGNIWSLIKHQTEVINFYYINEKTRKIVWN
jgi:tRNA threonylcarbamoyladenosine biosynthesis protein TsaE